ncbi:MAG: TetR family transcriptional regulator C-terminal domain-containing protein, partial [Cyanobacteria bacterium J06639_1]
INRGSLYDTFGDKRGLFQAAIAFYDDKVVRKAIAHLEAPGASKQAIVEHFLRLADLEDADCRGCLVTNAAVEMGIRDPDLHRQIAANLQRIEDAFFKALTRAQDKGEVAADVDTRSLARYFTCVMQGVRVMSRLRPDPLVLQSIVTVALSTLQAPEA